MGGILISRDKMNVKILVYYMYRSYRVGPRFKISPSETPEKRGSNLRLLDCGPTRYPLQYRRSYLGINQLRAGSKII